MIINNKANNVAKEGEFSSKRAMINQDKLAKLQYVLTKGLYSNPINAVIREISANAIDSVVQSGKNPVENPIIVKLDRNKFSVEDKGLGLSKQEFEEVCMNYLTSTKEDSNNSIGFYGIGLKSFLSLDRAATFTCRKDGVECKFLAYQGEEFMEYDLIYERETTEENGVLFEIDVDYDYYKFSSVIKDELSYYDTLLLYIDGVLQSNSIYRSNLWQYSTGSSRPDMHFCLKDVVYPINWSKLGIGRINLPIALRFNLDDNITPTPSREDVIWNDETIALFKKRIGEVSDWFINKYNTEWKEEKNIVDCWDKINLSTKHLDLGFANFRVDMLSEHSSVQFNPLVVKNIKLRPLSKYKNLDILKDYRCLVFLKGGVWSTKRASWTNIKEDVINKINVVLVNDTPVGKFRQYLEKEKIITYRNTIIVKKLFNLTLKNYIAILDLHNEPKSSWRALIQEFQYVKKQFEDKMKDVSKLETSSQYLQWLEKEKEEQKEKRRNGITTGNHKVLNKKEDEVTIAYARNKYSGAGITFEKNTYKVNTLHRNNYLTLYFTSEDILTATKFAEICSHEDNLDLRLRLKIAIIGERDIKKVQHLHNFKNYKQFMQESSVFKRTVTAYLYKRIIDKVNQLYDFKSLKVIKTCLPKFKDDIEILENYKNKNFYIIRDQDLLNSMLEEAEKNKLYDYSLWDVYTRVVDNLEKYHFLTFLKTDLSTPEDNKRLSSLINQILYHQQKYRALHQDLEIIVNPIVKEGEEEVIKEEGEVITQDEQETVDAF